MKIILYYLFLLVAIGLIAGYTISETRPEATMGMKETASICGALVIYTVALSLVGEGKLVDEREQSHRYTANRIALVVGISIMTLGIIVRLFVSHTIDYGLLIALMGVNLTKIISLIWLNYKK